jgi:hypothetical protein
MSNEQRSNTLHSEGFLEALEALRRARRQAEALAIATDTCLIQAVNGKPVRVSPKSLSAKLAAERPEHG